MDEKQFLRELRCPECRGLICKEYIYDGVIEVKCSRCNTSSTFRFRDIKALKKKKDRLNLVDNKSLSKGGE